MKVDTNGSGGKTLKKKITVLTNDPGNPKLFLTVSGEVEKFATIQPKKVNLIGDLGENLSKSVIITPEKRFPFSIVDIQKPDNSNIEVKIEKTDKATGEYTLFVQNMKKDQGHYNEKIELITDSMVKPKLTISVNGLIR